jgi:hypothetical protein
MWKAKQSGNDYLSFFRSFRLLFCEEIRCRESQESWILAF